MGVHEAEFRRRHAQLDAVLRDAQIARQRQLQTAADRVPRQHRERRQGERFEGFDRFGERVRDELLRTLFELLVGDLADVIARGEHPVRARQQHAARLRVERGEFGQRGADGVEDGVVERVALGGVGDRQAHHPLRRLVDQELAVGH